MKVILIDEDAFFELFERVLDHVETKLAHQEQNNWLTPVQAMKKLNITSKTTLQRYRDEGKVRYTKIGRKNILYDPKSIDDFLNSHVKDIF